METKMKVELINHTPEPEKSITKAAKLCYSRGGVKEIQENLTPENTSKFVEMIINMGHLSVVEHVVCCFALQGVSRALTHQLVRHRIASYSQQSMRYVKLDQFDYIVPPEIKKADAEQLFVESMERAQEDYDGLVRALVAEGLLGYIQETDPKEYERYLKEKDKVEFDINSYVENMQIDKKAYSEIEKKAIEDARYVLPHACETKIVFTMNVRTLYNFFEVRCCERAQWEIRQLAMEMLKQCKEMAPVLFGHAGPSCVKGSCKEGSMSCGKAGEVREKIKKL